MTIMLAFFFIFLAFMTSTTKGLVELKNKQAQRITDKKIYVTDLLQRDPTPPTLSMPPPLNFPLSLLSSLPEL